MTPWCIAAAGAYWPIATRCPSPPLDPFPPSAVVPIGTGGGGVSGVVDLGNAPTSGHTGTPAEDGVTNGPEVQQMVHCLLDVHLRATGDESLKVRVQ